MNRQYYFDYIEEKLSTLATRVEIRGKLNILDLHLHSENFYLHFFNELFGWKLDNMNAIKQNTEAIDLIDTINRIIVQVSSTATKHKVEAALTKDLTRYKGYSFKFISISKDAADLRTKTFLHSNPVTFIPSADIYDIKSILDAILTKSIAEQKQLYIFIQKELGSENDTKELESNIATIIGILSKQDLNKDSINYEVVSFEIERKIDCNNLNSARDVVDDYVHYHNMVQKIYAEFDKQGVNKSLSVLSAVRSEYLTYRKTVSDDALFFKTIESVIERVRKSANYKPLPLEELEMCVKIIVVDAFIRCKVFKNPKGYSYVTS